MEDLLALRVFNALLGCVALVLLAFRVTHDWDRFGPRARLLSLALLSLLFTGAYGSIEAHVQHAPTGTRTYMVTVAYLWIIAAFTLTRRGPFYRK